MEYFFDQFRCICADINGAAAHLIGMDEEIIIIGFKLSKQPIIPRLYCHQIEIVNLSI